MAPEVRCDGPLDPLASLLSEIESESSDQGLHSGLQMPVLRRQNARMLGDDGLAGLLVPVRLQRANAVIMMNQRNETLFI